MNTYNDNLLVAVTGTLSTIAAEQSKRESEHTVAEYNLYYAVGAQLLAQDKLEQVEGEYDKTMLINDQGVANSNQANDLMNYAETTDQNVTAVVTNTATVAQNVQAAANAILKLAANIGSANNIVSASDHDTDLQKMTEKANKVINETAYQAELTSQLAMEASTIASQIISKQVLLDVTATKALFDEMGKRTQADLTTLTQSRIADTDKLIAANSTQQAAEGSLKKTQQQYKAAQQAYEIANFDLNFDLKVDRIERDRINLSFDPLLPPFGDKQSNNGTEYYMTVVKASIKDSFSFDIAEGFFNEHKDKRFLRLTPGKNIPVLLESGSLDAQIAGLIESLDTERKKALCDAINETFGAEITPEQISEVNSFKKLMTDYYAKNNKKVPDNLGEFLGDIKSKNQQELPFADDRKQPLYMDSDGDKITTGTSYVIFLYLVLDSNYKKEVNNFSDRLSASSNAFTLTSALKAVDNITYQYTGADDPANNPAGKAWGLITFEIEHQPDTEYRCIFLPSWSTSQDTCVGANEAPVKIWFNLAMAKQLSETNYTRAEQIPDASFIKPGDHTKRQVLLNEKTTNNFGQLISQGATYIPVILSIIPESKKLLADSTSPALSSLDAKPIELLAPDKSKQSGEVKVLEPAPVSEAATAPEPSEPKESEQPASAPVSEAATTPEPSEPKESEPPATTPTTGVEQTPSPVSGAATVGEQAGTEHRAIRPDSAPKK
jgi:hypothetical protein